MGGRKHDRQQPSRPILPTMMTPRRLTQTLVLLAALGAATASGQGLLDTICDAATERGETAAAVEYRANPGAHSDDFCALARFGDAHKAARQLNKSIRITRRFENPNRYYFDRSRNDNGGYEDASFIQLLRPWMADENADGVAQWRVSRTVDVWRELHPTAAVLIHDESVRWPCTRAYRLDIEGGKPWLARSRPNGADGAFDVWFADDPMKPQGYRSEPFEWSLRSSTTGAPHGGLLYRTYADSATALRLDVEAALDDIEYRPIGCG